MRAYSYVADGSAFDWASVFAPGGSRQLTVPSVAKRCSNVLPFTGPSSYVKRIAVPLGGSVAIADPPVEGRPRSTLRRSYRLAAPMKVRRPRMTPTEKM